MAAVAADSLFSQAAEVEACQGRMFFPGIGGGPAGPELPSGEEIHPEEPAADHFGRSVLSEKPLSDEIQPYFPAA